MVVFYKKAVFPFFFRQRWNFDKARKIENFVRVSAIVFFKTSNILWRVFLGQIKKEKFFFWIFGKKECFWDQESELFKVSKKSKLSKNFPIFQKIVCFLTGIFRLNKPEKILFLYSAYTRIFVRPEKWNFEKVRKIEIFLTGPAMVLVKNSNILS